MSETENKNDSGLEEVSQTKSSFFTRLKKDPVKAVTYSILILCLILFIFHVVSDRHIPYTDQARIKGLAIPIAPRVAGNLTEINVKLHTTVQVGDTLFQLDVRPFDLAIKNAEAKLDNTAQQVGARTATVKSATGRLGVARAQLDRAQRNYNRVETVLQENPGALSQADKDAAETGLSQAIENVASAEADLEKAKQQLGTSGPDNPQLRAAVVSLEQAHLDREFSTIYAPAAGVIESFNVDLGYYSQPGQSLAMLITTNDIWIQADLKENNISNMKPGNTVDIILDIAPGTIFEGRVRSIGYGVQSGYNDRNDLPNVESKQSWLRDPQRFPVIITVDNEDFLKYSRLGGQADIVVYTGDYPLLNSLGWLRLKINGWLSYIR